MQSIRLKNGVMLNCLSVLGERQFVRGLERDCLTFNFKMDDYNLDGLKELFNTAENTSEIVIYSNVVNQNSEENSVDTGCLYVDYSLFLELEVKDEVIQKEDNVNAEEKIFMVSVAMGQLSYTEKLEKERNTQLDNLSEVVSDILGGAL